MRVTPVSCTTRNGCHTPRNQSALAVREPHKARAVGFVEQALATFSEHPDTLISRPRKVLRDNLLLAMGTMLKKRSRWSVRERSATESYRRLLAQAREYVLENSATVSRSRSVPAAVRQPSHLAERLPCDTGIGPDAWLKRIPPNAVRREPISPWPERETVREAAMQWRLRIRQFATDYQQLFAEKPSMTLHHRLRQWV